MTPNVIKYIVTAALGYVAARFASELFGLDDLAVDLAEWWKQNLPSITYESNAL